MNHRGRDLEDRQAMLVARCAAQRTVIAEEAARLRAGAARIDREVGAVGRWAVHPAVIGASIVLAYLLMRSRPLRTVGTVLALLPPVLRIVAAGRRVRRGIRHVR